VYEPVTNRFSNRTSLVARKAAYSNDFQNTHAGVS
jgi:hypothetical protein